MILKPVELNTLFTHELETTKYGVLSKRIDADGIVNYYKKNSWTRHRCDGPAVIWGETLGWWFNGDAYLFEEWLKKTNCSDDDKILLLIKYG